GKSLAPRDAAAGPPPRVRPRRRARRGHATVLAARLRRHADQRPDRSHGHHAAAALRGVRGQAAAVRRSGGQVRRRGRRVRRRGAGTAHRARGGRGAVAGCRTRTDRARPPGRLLLRPRRLELRPRVGGGRSGSAPAPRRGRGRHPAADRSGPERRRVAGGNGRRGASQILRFGVPGHVAPSPRRRLQAGPGAGRSTRHGGLAGL
ncbi:MAG: Transcriptional regulator, AcrR family, partial [uncultured Acetobacteraceae bacterium]